MIIIKLSGGLGNQLFQYAFGKAQSLRNKTDLRIDISGYKKNPHRSYKLAEFLISAPSYSPNFITLFIQKIFRLLESRKPLSQRKIILEPRYSYSPEVLDIPEGIFIGNWQSEKYFSPIADLIRKEFVLKEWSKAAMRWKDMIQTGKSGNPVSLHVRRGDIASDPHLLKKHGLLGLDYYKLAVQLISQKVPDPLFYIFTDDPQWAKENLSFLPKSVLVSGDNVSDAEEVSLMSLCKHHVIANSSFSWWGAWLNPSSEKIVIAPTKWFNTDTDTADLLPKTWKRI